MGQTTSIVAARYSAERLGKSTFLLVLISTILQTIVTLSMGGFVYP